jgi:hypothetical protein
MPGPVLLRCSCRSSLSAAVREHAYGHLVAADTGIEVYENPQHADVDFVVVVRPEADVTSFAGRLVGLVVESRELNGNTWSIQLERPTAQSQRYSPTTETKAGVTEALSRAITAVRDSTPKQVLDDAAGMYTFYWPRRL